MLLGGLEVLYSSRVCGVVEFCGYKYFKKLTGNNKADVICHAFHLLKTMWDHDDCQPRRSLQLQHRLFDMACRNRIKCTSRLIKEQDLHKVVI